MNDNNPFAKIPNQSGNQSQPSKNWCSMIPVPDDAPAPPEQHPTLGTPSQRWVYRDGQGRLLGHVLRFETAAGKIFRPLTFCTPSAGGKAMWRWESWATPRPLYGLDKLAAKPGAPIVICEGEKACDAAQSLLPDHVSVTSPNGSKSAAKADWTPLKGRSVTLWPDADEAGKGYATDLSKVLQKAGVGEIQLCAPPPEVSQGWDAADALQEGWTPDKAQAFVASAKPIAQPPLEEKSKRQRAPAQRDSIISLTEFCEPWHSADGIEFITMPIRSHRENWPVRSRRFKSWLSGQACERMGLAPGGQAIEDSLRVLEARALNEGPEKTPWRRVGKLGDKIIIDLCDPAWRVIEVTKDGWQIIERHDYCFLRSPAMQPLPDPRPGKNINLLRNFINTASNDDFILTISWILAALAGRSAFPVLFCQGPQGSAKSSYTRIIRSLIDPNVEPLRSLPKDDRDTAVACKNSYVVAFDNVSHLDKRMSDFLCQVSTGGGFSSRELHTNDAENTMTLLNPVIMNGIPSLAEQNDLMDRAITVRLKMIPESERLTEKRLKKEWEESQPYVLGALLDIIASGLRSVDGLKLTSLPRMADFYEWCIACEPAARWGIGEFSRAYAANRKEAAELSFENDPVAVAMLKLAQTTAPGQWHGTATELLAALSDRVSEAVRRQRNWPITAQGLSNRLERAAPLLSQQGVSFEKHHSGKRTITIWFSPPET